MPSFTDCIAVFVIENAWGGMVRPQLEDYNCRALYCICESFCRPVPKSQKYSCLTMTVDLAVTLAWLRTDGCREVTRRPDRATLE